MRGKTIFAYAAGIVDGEGCIRLQKEPGGKVGVRVEVGNTSEWLCQWFKMQFGGYVSVVVSKNPKHRDLWRWFIVNTHARDFLTLILSYLQLKRPQAELAISFQNTKKLRTGRHLTDEERAVREATVIVMKNFNRKGRRS